MKYKDESLRASWWDYNGNGAYFITISTQDKHPFFGICEAGRMKLSLAGIIVQGGWYEIPRQFPFVELGDFIVMPDHIHGILIISKDDTCPPGGKPPCGDAINRVPTTGGITGKHNPMLQESLGRIIRWYKGRSTFEIRKSLPEFKWQSSYWDTIIRDERALDQISQYIRDNPKNWQSKRRQSKRGRD